MSKSKKYLACKLLQAKRAEFFWEKLALVPLNLLYPIKLSVWNTQNKKSRTTNWNFKEGTLNSRTFQGQIHFQGLFKENPKFKDFSRTVGTLAMSGPWSGRAYVGLKYSGDWSGPLWEVVSGISFSTGWKMVEDDPALHRSYVERGYSVVVGGTA